MRVNYSDLDRHAISYGVALCHLGTANFSIHGGCVYVVDHSGAIPKRDRFTPHLLLSQCHPLMSKYKIAMIPDGDKWRCYPSGREDLAVTRAVLSEAICLAVIRLCLGGSVNVPDNIWWSGQKADKTRMWMI